MDYQAILTYWFAAHDKAAAPSLWYRATKAQDDEIRSRFEDRLNLAKSNQLHWPENPQALLAQIILLDQMSRHIYRGTASAFASDELAQRLSQHAIDAHYDQALEAIECIFLYHPLRHAESLQLQNQSLDLLQNLKDKSGESWSSHLDSYLINAQSHRDIIARFGRFPHRNLILGRTDTLSEQSYLRDNPRNYSQASKSQTSKS